MNLSNDPHNSFDELSMGSDSFSRSSLFKLSRNQTSFGSLSSTDTKDYYSFSPGLTGNFTIYVTVDPVNGFSGQTATASDFRFQITDDSGNVLISYTEDRIFDQYTKALSFVSNSSTGTYYLEITNTSFSNFRYAATLNPDDYTWRGGEGDDVVVGTAGNDIMLGNGGADTINGSAGNDYIDGGEGSNRLRGDEGDDTLWGGSSFDDIQGNMGNDTEHGGLGGDWVVGGKDNDLLYGDSGDDIINGNLGDDICKGDVGNDIVRGGQGNDSIQGEAGNDWLSGDLGDDTISGGAGADTFHGMANISIDRIVDFNSSEGDRVVLDPGTTFSVAQVGADTVITVSGGQMILVGVTLSSLPSGWILGG